MTKTQTKQIVVDRHEFHEICQLSDEQLLNRVKRDLAKDATKVAFSKLVAANKVASMIELLLDRKRWAFSVEFALSNQTTAPDTAYKYLKSFGQQLRDRICELYCGNKKKFLKLLRALSKHTRIPEEDFERLVGWAQQIYNPMIKILGFKFPLPLLVFILKKVLDRLCDC